MYLPKGPRKEVLYALWEARDLAFWAEDCLGIYHTEEKKLIDDLISKIRDFPEEIS